LYLISGIPGDDRMSSYEHGAPPRLSHPPARADLCQPVAHSHFATSHTGLGYAVDPAVPGQVRTCTKRYDYALARMSVA